MNLIYPALFHKENGSYWVEFPDLEGCQSFGDTLEETIFNAKEALEGYSMTLFEQGKRLSPPSDILSIRCVKNSFTTLIECDITNKKPTSNSVKKTLTIPSWLNDMAISEGINFSGVLQEALFAKLHTQK